MSAIALSSGCFIGLSDQLPQSGVTTIELASHAAPELERITACVEELGIRVESVHCPCPRTRIGIDLAGPAHDWPEIKRSILETMEIARRVGARFVIVHAFYCVESGLATTDTERMHQLRQLAAGGAIGEYVSSDRYGQCMRRAIDSLKRLLPVLLREYPEQRLLIENLNPRLGYGGIRIADISTMLNDLGGDVGFCLDVGHLGLAEAVLGPDASSGFTSVAPLVESVHVHQNFCGHAAVDRHWNEHTPRRGLLDVDLHAPLLSRYREGGSVSDEDIGADNSAFTKLLTRRVVHSAEEGVGQRGTVPIEAILAGVPRDANLVLEYDSRYAPLSNILYEHKVAVAGRHPQLRR